MKYNYKNFTIHKNRIILAIPAALLTAGCAGPPISKSLENAREEYAKVQADPKIAANAQVAVFEAGQALQAAEQAKNLEQQEHLAYLAEKKSEIALAIADKSMAETEIQQFGKKRNEILLKSREQEIKSAKEEAKASKSQLEASKSQLQSTQMEVESARNKAQQAEAKARQMETELGELKGKQTDRGIVLTLGDVLFDTGKADLKPGAFQIIDRLSNFLAKHTDRNVIIEGHTDSVGGERYNIDLSRRRADSVRKALIDRGINADRIAIKGYGKSFPIASNKTAAGRQLNRRVEVVVLNPGVNPDSQIRQ